MIFMIPKKIHYVWLSNDQKPKLIKKCISSWKKTLPDYSVRQWSMNDFNFTEMPAFVQEALEKKKWAFVTDYLRLYILYNYGGIYLDSDIFIKKDINLFLQNDFFSFVEYHEKGFKNNSKLIDKDGNPLTKEHIPGFCIQAAFMGSKKGHPFIKTCLDYYNTKHFINNDGSFFTQMIAPDIYGICARDYGFKYINKTQNLKNNMTIYPSCYVAGSLNEIKKNNYAVHCCAGSWRERGTINKILMYIKTKYKTIIYLR
ncbi:MAG: glycosyltransferase family 32 protein [Candidatus Gastranaerophilaceae bacterium]